VTTILHPSTRQPDVTIPDGVDLLLGLLDDALLTIAETDPELLHTGTPAGRQLSALAAVARQATGRLGADPGVALTHGPGVVVVRDLVAARRRLGRASAGSHAAGDDSTTSLTATAKGLHARLLEAVTSAG
jgi:hypothetical protein